MAQYRKDNHTFINDSKTIFEAVILADKYGNAVGGANPTGTAVDAFGRARTSHPLTLFDSFHRYQDNGKITVANSSTGSFTYNTNSSEIGMVIDTTSGAYAKRESSRVFSYQPGKSLLILHSFVFNQAKTGLRQRIGYFGEFNGVYLELNELQEPKFVIKSYSSGSVTYESVSQSNWNRDTLLGDVANSPSKKTLDISKAQILFFDIEWLGVGSIRCGFIIDGEFIHCHTFHHSNIINTTYMTTACLPVRAEIENLSTTSSSSTMKIICTSVMSEGGYEIRGKTRTYGLDFTNQMTLTSAGTYYPVVSIRINPDKPDSIVIPKQIDALPNITGNANFRWKIISGGTITGGTWVNVASDSSVQYQSNNAATISGGIELSSGYMASTTQAHTNINISDPDIFKYQLERNSFANTTTPFTLVVTSDTATSNIVASMTWMEIT